MNNRKKEIIPWGRMISLLKGILSPPHPSVNQTGNSHKIGKRNAQKVKRKKEKKVCRKPTDFKLINHFDDQVF